MRREPSRQRAADDVAALIRSVRSGRTVETHGGTSGTPLMRQPITALRQRAATRTRKLKLLLLLLLLLLLRSVRPLVAQVRVAVNARQSPGALAGMHCCCGLALGLALQVSDDRAVDRGPAQLVACFG
jgi:hypothetical protein